MYSRDRGTCFETEFVVTDSRQDPTAVTGWKVYNGTLYYPRCRKQFEGLVEKFDKAPSCNEEYQTKSDLAK